MLIGLVASRCRALLESWDTPIAKTPLAMDHAYEGGKTRLFVQDLMRSPIMPRNQSLTCQTEFLGLPASNSQRRRCC